MKLLYQDITKKMTQKDCIKEMVDLFVENKVTSEDYYDAILKRQKQASFYIGNFVAIPHGVVENKNTILKTGIAIFRFKKPIKWDGNDVHYVIAIASKSDDHMEILTNIAINFDSEQKVKDSLNLDLKELVNSLGWKS